MNEQDDMDLKRAMDALPRSIEPPADLWPGVRGRLSVRVARGRASRLAPLVRSLHSIHRIAALLAILAISGSALLIQQHAQAQWSVHASDGFKGRLHAGDSLQTHAQWTALSVGTIGTVNADSGASLRVITARSTEQRLQLRQGRIQARINAPPRLFIVETPTTTAIDLGCEYTLSVDSDGTSRLAVTIGWVELQNAVEDFPVSAGESRALIPAGMHAVARPHAALGTPVRDDATPDFQRAVDAFDQAPSDSALSVILGTARKRDAVTLWHLVGRTGGPLRSRVIDRLVALVPPPDGVPREALEHANYGALTLYWTRLPGTLPIVPSWQSALWKMWLRIAG